jgi:Fe2+ or Zn2+ uptake regulation protein
MDGGYMKYFQHDTNSRTNRKLRKVLRTHGTTGYAIWWAILEELYANEDSGFEIKADELWLETLAESLCISDHRTLIRVLDTFAEVGLISRQHWQEEYLFIEAIHERGDNYIQKKTANAKRQARFREKQKEASRVSNALRNAKSNEVTPSDIDLDPETDKNKNSPSPKGVSSLSEPEEVFLDGENSTPVNSGQMLSNATSSSPGFTPPKAAATPLTAEAIAAKEREQERWSGLPAWKTGTGRNDWNEEILTGLVAWLNSINSGGQKTRADAIAYIVRRQHPEHPEHISLLTRVEEIQQKFHESNATASRIEAIRSSGTMNHQGDSITSRIALPLWELKTM